MSRHTSLESLPVAMRRRGPGRHRSDVPGGVRCADLPAVAALMQSGTKRSTGAFLRSLWSSVPTGRHTWDFMSHAGGRPRTAFAIILSL